MPVPPTQGVFARAAFSVPEWLAQQCVGVAAESEGDRFGEVTCGVHVPAKGRPDAVQSHRTGQRVRHGRVRTVRRCQS